MKEETSSDHEDDEETPKHVIMRHQQHSHQYNYAPPSSARTDDEHEHDHDERVVVEPQTVLHDGADENEMDDDEGALNLSTTSAASSSIGASSVGRHSTNGSPLSLVAGQHSPGISSGDEGIATSGPRCNSPIGERPTPLALHPGAPMVSQDKDWSRNSTVFSFESA
jgi:hypothetical protein